MKKTAIYLTLMVYLIAITVVGTAYAKSLVPPLEVAQVVESEY